MPSIGRTRARWICIGSVPCKGLTCRLRASPGIEVACYQGSAVASRAIVMQRKTQRPVQFEITEAARDSVAAWVARAQLRSASHLLTHSLRRTKATLIYRRTKNIRAIQL